MRMRGAMPSLRWRGAALHCSRCGLPHRSIGSVRAQSIVPTVHCHSAYCPPHLSACWIQRRLSRRSRRYHLVQAPIASHLRLSSPLPLSLAVTYWRCHVHERLRRPLHAPLYSSNQHVARMRISAIARGQSVTAHVRALHRRGSRVRQRRPASAAQQFIVHRGASCHWRTSRRH